MRVLRSVSTANQCAVVFMVAVFAPTANGFGQTIDSTVETQRPVALRNFETCRQALDVALLAAENGFHDLSLQAVNEALSGGPPVDPIKIQTTGIATASASNQSDAMRSRLEPIRLSLVKLTDRWSKDNVDAVRVFETLADVVFPPGRPQEIFLYEAIVNPSATQAPANLGKQLIQWAQKADRLDELQQRIAEKRTQPRSRLHANVMQAELALLTRDHQVLVESLQGMSKHLVGNTVSTHWELALHVALPALNNPKSETAALPLVENAAESVARRDQNKSGELLIRCSQAYFRIGKPKEARRVLDRFLQVHQENNSRYSGTYGLHLRKQQLTRVAHELIRGEQFKPALEMLGQASDFEDPDYRSGAIDANTAAAFERLALQLPVEERFDALLKWTLPSGTRKNVRIIAGPISEESPPAVFEHVSGGNANEESVNQFELARSGPFPCVVSSVDLLIDSARATGQLDKLKEDVRAFVDKKAPNADILMILCEAATGNVDGVTELAKSWQTQLQAQQKNRQMRPAQSQLWASYLVARTLMADPKLKRLGRTGYRPILALSKRIRSTQLTKVMQRDDAGSAALFAGKDFRRELANPQLKHWIAGDQRTAATIKQGSVKASWVGHEGHLHHRAGPRHSYLFFKYPLTGSFDVQFDAWNGGYAEGHASFGGLTIENWGWNRSGLIFAYGEHGAKRSQFPFSRPNAYNRFHFRSRADGVRTYLNGHLIYHDKEDWSTSPWLALFARDTQVTDFRNVRISGTPVIPRQVKLVSGSSLRGWVANFYADSIPEQLTSNSKGDAVAKRQPPAWRAVDGIIQAETVSDADDSPVQSRLYYGRPLARGESLQYEFLYEPGKTHVHPAIDRLAFILDPNALKLHWMTTGSDEWTGLAVDNAVSILKSASETAGIPLKENQWNRVRLLIVRGKDGGDVLRLSLNQQQIYEQRLQPDVSRTFGFFRYRNRTAARIRNVVMRSNRWPEKLTDDILADLTASERRGKNPFQRARMRYAMIGEKYLARDAWLVWRKAVEMQPETRFAYLKNWVMPGRNHSSLRLTGDFTPARPSPAAFDKTAAAFLSEELGGQIVAPALLLVDTAKELGKLDEFHREVDEFKVATNLNNQRARIALLGIIALVKDDKTAAAKYLDELIPLLKKAATNTIEAYRWPELLFGSVAAQRRFEPSKVQNMLRHIDVVQKPRVSAVWKKHLQHLRGVCIHATLKDLDGKKYTEPLKLALWKPVSHIDTSLLAAGTPGAHWSAHAGQLRHYPGSQHDNLYYQIPIRGNFEVSADVSGWREIQIGYAGTIVSLGWGRGDFHVSHLGRNQSSQKFKPPLQGVDYRFKYRMVVKDGTYQTFVNDRKIHEQKLAKNPDPWLVLYQPSGYHGFAKNLEIKGNITVPEEISLSDDPNMTGWHSDFFSSVNASQKKIEWKFEGGEIKSNKQDLTGSGRQSILRYHRPLFEDGELEYEFYYEPNETMVHPALGRLTFLLDPDGVKVHWLTDGMFERSSLSVHNAIEEPDNRLGPNKLPLKPKAWNQLKLTLKGDSTTIELNGQPVFKRKLNAQNNRVFGFFHYADESAIRIKNVIYRGEWPKELKSQNLITDMSNVRD